MSSTRLRSEVGHLHWLSIPGSIGATILSLVYQLEQSQWLSPDEVRRRQAEQLTCLVEHSARCVPHYRRQLEGLEVSGPDAVERVWSQIPILGRQELQDSKEHLVSDPIPEDHLPTRWVRSTGSTGTPVEVLRSRVNDYIHEALNMRYHRWFERDFSAKAAFVQWLPPDPSDPGPTFEPDFPWAPLYDTGPTLLCEIRTPPPVQLDWLAQTRPAYLLTFPSNLAALLAASRQSGQTIDSLQHVATFGEVLDDDTRESCLEVWGCPVVDAYSAEEVGFIAVQCPTCTDYHVQAENLLVEILRSDGTPCAPGEVGRVVVTDLNNFAMPLIRYDLGDFAEVGRPCSCGRGLPTLRRIIGRSRNMMQLPDDTWVWPVYGGTILHRVAAPIMQAQVVQVGRTEITLNLVTEAELTREQEKLVHDFLMENLGFRFELTFHYVAEIPRGAGGKFEDFRCDLPGKPRAPLRAERGSST